MPVRSISGRAMPSTKSRISGRMLAQKSSSGDEKEHPCHGKRLDNNRTGKGLISLGRATIFLMNNRYTFCESKPILVRFPQFSKKCAKREKQVLVVFSPIFVVVDKRFAKQQLQKFLFHIEIPSGPQIYRADWILCIQGDFLSIDINFVSCIGLEVEAKLL